MYEFQLEGDVLGETNTKTGDSSFTTCHGTVSWAPTTGGAR